MKIPEHVAIIMDGNGRWAQQRNLSRSQGHRIGVESVREIVSVSAERKVKTLTLFAFSQENSQRPEFEIRTLMNLFVEVLYAETTKLHEHGVKIQFIGDRSLFSSRLTRAMYNAEKLTQDNQRLHLILAMNYSGRWDMKEAAKAAAEDVQKGLIEVDDIDEHYLQSKMALAGINDPDLLIRTIGEKRISNFLLWNFAYTELYFTDVYWPEFRREAFDKALSAYSNRKRRFGLIQKQADEKLHAS